MYKANENCCNMWRCTKSMKTVVTCVDVQSQWKLLWLCISPHVTTVFIGFVHLHILQQFSLALYIYTCYNSFHWLCTSPHVTTVFISIVHLHMLQQFSLALYISTCYNNFHWLSSLDIFQCIKHHFLSNNKPMFLHILYDKDQMKKLIKIHFHFLQQNRYVNCF
jgi:hypothetical protein